MAILFLAVRSSAFVTRFRRCKQRYYFKSATKIAAKDLIWETTATTNKTSCRPTPRLFAELIYSAPSYPLSSIYSFPGDNNINVGLKTKTIFQLASSSPTTNHFMALNTISAPASHRSAPAPINILGNKQWVIYCQLHMFSFQSRHKK